MNNSSKVILITGATAGIGKAGALELGRRGWSQYRRFSGRRSIRYENQWKILGKAKNPLDKGL